MEREFEVIGTQPLRFRGKYIQPGDKVMALLEEVAFYVQIGAIAHTGEGEVPPSDPELVRKTMRRNATLNRGGVDSVPAVQSATPGSAVRRVEME
jgi:hypothetical protein